MNNMLKNYEELDLAELKRMAYGDKSPYAYYELGRRIENNIGMEAIDKSKCIEMYLRAADSNLIEARKRLIELDFTPAYVNGCSRHFAPGLGDLESDRLRGEADYFNGLPQRSAFSDYKKLYKCSKERTLSALSLYSDEENTSFRYSPDAISLGMCYFYGVGTKRNYRKAIEYYIEALMGFYNHLLIKSDRLDNKNGILEGFNQVLRGIIMLSSFYTRVKKYFPNESECEELITLPDEDDYHHLGYEELEYRASLNDTKALVYMGFMYLHGGEYLNYSFDIKPDLAKAISYFKRASRTSSIFASLKLSGIYYNMDLYNELNYFLKAIKLIYNELNKLFLDFIPRPYLKNSNYKSITALIRAGIDSYGRLLEKSFE